jgi:hypothetical protein
MALAAKEIDMQSAKHRPRTRPPNRPAARKDARRPPNEQPALFDLAPPEQPTGTYQTSVYRLDRVPPTADRLPDGLNHRYLRENQFVPEARLVAGAQALLVYGTVGRERAEWCDVLTSLTDHPVELGFSSGGAALLVAVDDRVYALTYGTLGRFMMLGPDSELIHVKRADRSAPLSHLFAQGVVSMDALKYEADARKALVEMARRQNPGHRIDLDFRPRKVVYAIALGPGRALTVNSLFTFAQVALYRAVKALRNEDVDVEVIGIPSS